MLLFYKKHLNSTKRTNTPIEKCAKKKYEHLTKENNTKELLMYEEVCNFPNN